MVGTCTATETDDVCDVGGSRRRENGGMNELFIILIMIVVFGAALFIGGMR